MPTALQSILDGHDRFRTVFYAHECATARYLVEHHAGHDTMFYNVLDQARHEGHYAEDVFGDLDHLFRHALIKRSHLCDGIIAVGDRTRDEMFFLGDHFDDEPIDVVYNGLPAGKVGLQSKLASRGMLADYAEALLGCRPDLLMTHVTRPVISKGLWRDLKVCHSLDEKLAAKGQSGVLVILSTGAGVRRPRDIALMEQHYDWPRRHREGYPDLVGPEVGLNEDIETFNRDHQAVQVILVNQFGWSAERIGRRLPQQMNIADLRRGTDVEFGMATYEPFGISPLEPLGAGALCVISSVCGCKGFVDHVTDHQGTPNVIEADFVSLDQDRSVDQLKAMNQPQRDGVEEAVARQVADTIMQRLPNTDDHRRLMIESGQALVGKMGWDQVLEDGLLPMLRRVTGNGDGERAGRVA